MKTRNIATTLVLIAMAAAQVQCSNDVLADSDATDERLDDGRGTPVSVIVTVPGGSRAADLTRSENFKEFSMYGFNVTEAKTLVRNKNIHWTKSDDSWVASAPVTWPDEGTMDFYAIAPTLDKPLISKTVMTAKKRTITHTVPTDIDEQQDLMLAVSVKQTEQSHDKSIVLAFTHTLPMLTFSIKNKVAERYKVTIHGLNVYNLKSTGTMTINGNSYTWNVADDSYADYTMTLPEDMLLATNDGINDYEPLLTEDTRFFVTMEQKSSAYSGSKKTPKVVKPDAYNDHKSFVGVLCRIQDTQQSDAYVVGSATEWKEVYFGFGGKQWYSGTTYLNKINFNGGYDDDGSFVMDNLPDVVTTEDEADFNAIITEEWKNDDEGNSVTIQF